MATPKDTPNSFRLLNSGNIDYWNKVYADVAAANLAIPNTLDGDGNSFRDGKVVQIGTSTVYEEYRWKGGFADINLRPSNIGIWQAIPYPAYTQRSNIGTTWTSNADTLATDVPGVSGKWVDDLFRKLNKQDKGFQVLSENDFSVNSAGVTAFNGGTFVLNTAASRIEVSSNMAQGVSLSQVLTIGATYKLFVNITVSAGNEVNIYNNYSGVLLKKITKSGQYSFTFIASATDPGGFGKKIFVLSNTAAGTFYVNGFVLEQPSGVALFAVPLDIDSLNTRASNIESDLAQISSFTTLTENTFTVSLTGLVTFDGSVAPTLDAGNGRAVIDQLSGDKGVYVNPNLVAGKTYMLVVDITVGTSGAKIFRNWPNKILDITNSGIYKLVFTAGASGVLGNRMIITTSAAGIFYINDIKLVELVNDNANQQSATLSYVDQKVDAVLKQPTEILIGLGTTNADGPGYASVVVGKNAKGSNTLVANTALTQGETVVMGESAVGVSRSVAIGAKTYSLAQSSTSVGCGAYVMKTHGGAYGRGSAMDGKEGGIAMGDPGLFDFWLASCFAHRRIMAPSKIGRGNVVPSTKTIVFHGQDAHDQRPYAWVSGVTVSEASTYYLFNNQLFWSKVAGTTTDPAQDSAKWGLQQASYLAPDVAGDSLTADDFNVAGGHIAIAGGAGTGIGPGGKVKIQTAPVSGTKGQNEKNTLVDCADFDTSTNVSDSTRFRILDIATGTLRRVKIGAPDSGGTGKRMLTVDN